MQFRIVPCREWGARRPRRPNVLTGRPVRIIEHHTASHAPNLDAKPRESYAEAAAYARSIQAFHMDERGWNDTGRNFLVSRSGHIFEGRNGSLAAIRAGRMVVSAHCPGQNDQPGIEHEHFGDEPLTDVQKEASIWLHAFICRQTGIRPTEFYGHRRYYATACPTASIEGWIPDLRLAVARELTGAPA
ncbi:MAG: N-acetylmuramoyl-L-alanine amidase, partial [Actinomycetota bacterium]|nr:N-acetylmuramoyl-L-alanine amidase [Actinomycetota bacterium]